MCGHKFTNKTLILIKKKVCVVLKYFACFFLEKGRKMNKEKLRVYKIVYRAVLRRSS